MYNKDEDETVEDIAYKPFRTFRHDTRPHAIAWSPETSLSVVPKVLMFCVAGADFKIRLYSSDLNENTVCEVRLKNYNKCNLFFMNQFIDISFNTRWKDTRII